MKLELIDILREYFKSTIQSEAEVSSKFIIPLLEYLGYPSELRAQEFPVYGFEGRKMINSKSADFIMFSEPCFASYRKATEENHQWVYDHSLLVIEAKKPGQMPEIAGQPEYYSLWTRSLAYIITDGVCIRGYYSQTNTSDSVVINCKVEELNEHCSELQVFSYRNLVEKKEEHVNRSKQVQEQLISVNTNKQNNEYSDVEVDNIDPQRLAYMREALGKNALGLSYAEIVKRFINMTDAYLQNDMRYDIPQYMMDIPRVVVEANLYLDNHVMPLIKGRITKFYWEEYETYLFDSDFFVAWVYYAKGTISKYEIGYQVLDNNVDDRLMHFDTVKKALYSENILIVVEDDCRTKITLPIEHSEKLWEEKNHIIGMMNFWINGLEKLKAIESYYNMRFKLKPVHGEDNLNSLYESIDFVFDGISMNTNCTIKIHGGFSDEDIEIAEPFLYEKDKVIPLPDRIIQGRIFRPYASAIMPGTIHVAGTKETDIIHIDACCLYRLVDE